MIDPNRPASDQPDEALEVAGGGTLNLDAWGLCRNFEIALGLDGLRNWFSDKVTYFL